MHLVAALHNCLQNYPPVRNSLHKKKKIKRKKAPISSNHVEPTKKSTKIPGYDFRAWDKYDVVSLDLIVLRQNISLLERLSNRSEILYIFVITLG